MNKLLHLLIVFGLAAGLFFTATSVQAQGGGLIVGNPTRSQGKVGGELISLHAEYQMYLQSGGGTFRPTTLMVRVVGERVIVDAVASGNPQTLRRDLEALGLRNAAVAGRLVSGQLPIAAIPNLNGVRSLQWIRAAYAMTNLR
jgi:hypothetical protein